MKKKRSLFKIGVVLVGILFFLLGRSSGSGIIPEQLVLASLIYFASMIPVIIYLLKGEKDIPYVPFFGIIFFVHFGNIFTNYKLIQLLNIRNEIVTYSLFLAFVGFISFLIAFYSKLGRFVESHVVHLDVSLDPSKCMNLGIVLFMTSFTITYFFSNYMVPILGEGVKAFIGQLSVLAITMFVLLFLQGKLNAFCKLLLWCVFLPLRFLLIISGGAVMPLVLEAATIFFIYFYCRQKIPWLMLILVSLLILRVWGVRDEFRNLTWFDGPYANESTFKRAMLYLELMSKMPHEQSNFDADAYERLSMRVNHMVTFVRVVDLTPSVIPYWGGYTYNTLLVSIIPRVLFPNKPTKTIGSEFGQRYALLSPDDTSTSYNLPVTVEMYVNFGFWGVVIGMFIFGLVIRAIYALVNYSGCGDGTFLIGATVFYNLLNVESNFSLVFGSVIQYSFLFYMIMGFMSASKRQLENEGAK